MLSDQDPCTNCHHESSRISSLAIETWQRYSEWIMIPNTSRLFLEWIKQADIKPLQRVRFEPHEKLIENA